MGLNEKKLIAYGKLLIELSYDSFCGFYKEYRHFVETNYMKYSKRFHIDFFSSLTEEQTMQFLYIQEKIAREVLKGFFEMILENRDKYKIVYVGEDFDRYIDLTGDLSKLETMLFEENGLIEKYSKCKNIVHKIREAESSIQ